MNLLPAFVGTPEENRVYHVDALTLINALASQSVDAAIFDPPYGTTACAWDEIIPLDAMWKALKRVVKPHGAIVITSSQPFTSKLVMSNIRNFRESLVWDKIAKTGYFNAKHRHMRQHEDILVFGYQGVNYYPQMLQGKPFIKKRSSNWQGYDAKSDLPTSINKGFYYPSTILTYSNADQSKGSLHPTEKPIRLWDYLIRTYTQEGDLVLDPTCGSGTTAIAARNTGRRFICGDLDAGYVEIARQRLAKPYTPDMFLSAAI